MGKDSHIEWTDHTFNPWVGCTKVSPGCANCYAAEQDKFRGWTPAGWGAGKPRKRTSEGNWKEPLRWNSKQAALVRCANLAGKHPPRRPRVFCASLADWLDHEVPTAWRVDLLALMQATPHLNWLLLTKRPQSWSARMHEAMGAGSTLAAAWLNGQAPANVWVGTTVEDQQRADERIAELLCIRAKVRFLSCEPMLGPIDLFAAKGDTKNSGFALTDGFGRVDGEGLGIHWVICGGESGPGARPMHPDWARSLRDQCAAVGVPFFFKQWGEWSICHPAAPDGVKTVSMFPDGRTLTMEEWFDHCAKHGGGGRLLEWRACAMVREGKKAAGRLFDGREHNEFPEVSS